MAVADNDLKAIGYLKLLTAIVFISMAIISIAAVLSFRSSNANQRTLKLVEQCVVDGDCGPQSGGTDDGTIRIVNYMIDAVGCILLVDPPARTPDDIQRCKLETAPR
jgi:hypothetical protein